MTQNLDRFKFRVWVRKYNGIKYNKMHYSYRMEYNYAFPNRDNHICIDTGTTNLDASKKFTMINNEGCQFSDRNSIVLMQSTGLKDKNGKLIYEGDIVKFIDYNCTPHKEVVREVRYVNTADYGFNTFLEPFSQPVCGDKLADGRWQLTVFTTPPSESEIIGNVYENPEFLNKKQSIIIYMNNNTKTFTTHKIVSIAIAFSELKKTLDLKYFSTEKKLLHKDWFQFAIKTGYNTGIFEEIGLIHSFLEKNNIDYVDFSK